jgi:hypothetical protein
MHTYPPGPANSEIKMEYLEFIFSSFWIFAGTVVILSICFDGTAGIVKGIARVIVACRRRFPSRN